MSMPVTWDEVRECLRAKDAGLLSFEAEAALRRVDKRGDLFAPLLALKQKLPRLSG
jgi:bifunctional non-homologous end joining protein LigD